MDTWNPAGESLVWVKALEVASKGRGRIFMRWHHSSPVVNDPQAVWTDYASVWHLDDADGEGDRPVQLDSTTNQMTAALNPNLDTAAAEVVDGKVGGALKKYDKVAVRPNSVHLFTAANYLTATGLAGQGYSVSGWIYYPEIESNPYTWKDIFKFGHENDYNGWKVSYVDNSMEKIKTTFSGEEVALSSTTNPKNGWVQWRVVYDGWRISFYLNNVFQLERQVKIPDTSEALQISPYMGYVDETRVYVQSLSDAYRDAEYETIVAQDFIDYGVAEQATQGLVIFLR